MKQKIFISSVQKEFAKERRVLKDYILGNEVSKPIPSYQIFKGTVFDLVNQSVDFVMSKLNRSVGTREHGPQAPVEYDIPQPVVSEAIVNAVAHRDYASSASVQVMLFSDRLEIWNPGNLPPSLTLASLRKPHASQPFNPLIAEPLFLTKYIEKAGTGTLDVIRLCRKHGLEEPKFSLENGCFVLTIFRKEAEELKINPANQMRVGDNFKGKPTQSPTQSIDPVDRLLAALANCELSSGELRDILQIKHRQTFRQNYLHPALNKKLIENTIPEKPNSRLQKYRLTEKGMKWVKENI
jgi:predicted HTH transcriptional regulator